MGSDQELTIGDLADMVAQRFSVGVNKAELTEQRIDRYVPSITKAKLELGLKLTIDLAGAIDKTIAAIRSEDLHA